MPTEPGRRPALAPPPRRAVAAILATALGLVLLFSFKTPDEAPVPSRPVAVAPAPTAGKSASPVGGLTSPPASAPASASPALRGGTQQVDGTVVSTRFGDVQVRLIESGNRITDVQALQLPFDRRRSLEISQFVEPILHDEALQAQSAQIDTISGATYTSEAYSRSLQSALDHANG